jgi:hypothetical protein
MPESEGQFEQKDNLGSTVAFNGTATTTPANVPAVAGNIISGFSIWNDGGVSIQISFDGGTTFHDHDKKSFLSHNIKGEPTQLIFKTVSSSAAYRVVINFEDF